MILIDKKPKTHYHNPLTSYSVLTIATFKLIKEAGMEFTIKKIAKGNGTGNGTVMKLCDSLPMG